MTGKMVDYSLTSTCEKDRGEVSVREEWHVVVHPLLYGDEVNLRCDF